MRYVDITGAPVEHSRNDLIAMVKKIMDEIDHNVIVDMGASDNYPVATLIDKHIDDSKNDVLSNARYSLLPIAVKTYSYDTVDESDSDIKSSAATDSGTVILPDDMVKFVSIRNEQWNSDVNSLINIEDRRVARQSYEFTRAKRNNPAAASIDGVSVMIFPFSKVVEKSNVLTYGDTVLKYTSSLTEYSDFGEQACNAICWNCAGRVFISMGMGDSAAKCMEMYNSIIK